MLIGSYLDCYITCPDILHELYFICDVERPTQKIVDLCDSLYQWIGTGFEYDKNIPMESDLTEYEFAIENWINTVDYYNNRPKTRVSTFIKEASEWWNVLAQKGDRQIITSLEELEAEIINIRLTEDPKLNWLWKGEFQKDFYWEEEGIGCKGLGDICCEDYVDIKYTTCSNLKDWIKVCASLNYPFQMAFYKSGLGFKKGYWLVVHKDWHELVEVSDLMLNIGKYGYRKKELIRTGEMEFNVIKKTPGYLDGLNLLKGDKEKTIEQLYLEQL